MISELAFNRPQIRRLLERLGPEPGKIQEERREHESLAPAPEPNGPAGRAQASDLASDLREFARLIDHTLLRPEATRSDIEQLCRESLTYVFGAVYVNPTWVSLAAANVRGSEVKVGTVVGFPFGATLPSVKRAEAAAVIRLGAQELDMVINIGALGSGDLDLVESDIAGVAEIAHASGCGLKVILEVHYLSAAHKVLACQIAQQAGADYVKTSTGFGPSGARAVDLRLMRETVGATMGVKAAGGIRTFQQALQMLAAGADRLGTSASVSILAEASRRGD